MAKIKEKEKALQLRRLGKSYSEIKSVLGVAKSTLSEWLRDYPLSDERISELRDWSERRIENYQATRRKTREDLYAKLRKEESARLTPFSTRDIFIGGLFLYWGEGAKTKLSAEVIISNTDPSVIKAFIYWLERVFHIDRRKVVIRLHLYKDMDVAEETRFWVKTLEFRHDQFRRPYIKKSTHSSLTYRHKFGHGTCNAMLRNAIVAKRVMAGLAVIQHHFGSVA